MAYGLPVRKRSLRLTGWSYQNAGWYFVTICTHERQVMFGEIEQEQLFLNNMGKIVQKHWLDITHYYPHVTLDEFVVMPNHLHGLLHLGNPVQRARVGSQLCCDRSSKNPDKNSSPAIKMPIIQTTPTGGAIRPNSLSAVIRNFKSYTTREINRSVDDHDGSVWQRSFHDRIVRSETELIRIRQYIRDNPKNWKDDPHYHP